MELNTRFLTIRETARTGILPEYRLRRLCEQGLLPGFYAGVKFLVNFPALETQLDDLSCPKGGVHNASATQTP